MCFLFSTGTVVFVFTRIQGCLFVTNTRLFALGSLWTSGKTKATLDVPEQGTLHNPSAHIRSCGIHREPDITKQKYGSKAVGRLGWRPIFKQISVVSKIASTARPMTATDLDNYYKSRVVARYSQFSKRHRNNADHALTSRLSEGHCRC